MSRKDEILEELDEILERVIHYLNGIRQDIERGDYTPDQAYVDVDFLDSSDVDYYSRVVELSSMRSGQDIPDNILKLPSIDKRPIPEAN